MQNPNLNFGPDTAPADSGARTSARVRQTLMTALKILVSLALLGWLAMKVDWAGAWATIRSIPWFLLVSGLLLVTAGQLLCTRRLQLLLAAQNIHISFYYGLRLTFVGLFSGNFLPSTVGGDGLKIIMLARVKHQTAASTLSVIADRVINLAAVALLLPSLFSLADLPGEQPLVSIEWGVAGLLAAGLAAAGVALFTYLYVRSNPASKLAGYITQWRTSILLIVNEWLKRPKLLLMGVILSLGSFISSVAAIEIQSISMGVPFNFVALVAVFVLNYFVTLLPISFNGLGIQEIGLVYLMTMLGATAGQAAALALLVRLFNLVVSLPGAFLLAGKL